VFIIGGDFAWQRHASLILCIHSGFTTEEGSELLGVSSGSQGIVATTERKE
jgi:hypothetical protein